MIDMLKKFASEIQETLSNGSDLRSVSRWSFALRQSGRDVPYLAILQTNEAGDVVLLHAAPTRKQVAMSQFFAERAPESRLPRYVFRISLDGVEFTERTSKTTTKIL